MMEFGKIWRKGPLLYIAAGAVATAAGVGIFQSIEGGGGNTIGLCSSVDGNPIANFDSGSATDPDVLERLAERQPNFTGIGELVCRQVNTGTYYLTRGGIHYMHVYDSEHSAKNKS
jgi:hypothetical protein